MKPALRKGFPSRFTREAGLAVATMLLFPASSPAIDFTWVGPDQGAFGTALNWSPFNRLPPFGPGGEDDTVSFDLGVPPAERYTVRNVSGANGAFYIRNDSLRLEISDYTAWNDFDVTPVPGITAPTMVVGFEAGDVGDLILTGEPGANLVTRRHEVIAASAGSIGRVCVTGGGWLWDSAQLQVGRYGDGELTIENGGTVQTGSCHVGLFDGGSGTAVVRGEGSSWTLGWFRIAHGDGMVIVEEGGTLNSSMARIDGDPKGELNIRGEGSSWNASGTSFFAYSDTGIVRIEDGALATAAEEVFLAAWEPEGRATAQVTGTGSRWDIAEDLSVGWGGTAFLTVEEGAQVSTRRAWLAGADASNPNADPAGTAVIEGAGSSWTISEEIGVGVTGPGEVRVENGGTLTSRDAWLGQEVGSHGSVTVRGARSRWTNPGEVFVGSHGEGHLAILEGGRVDNNGAWIGTSPGSTGTVTVKSKDSIWANQGQIFVGYRSVGFLEIEEGGTVTGTGNAFIGFVQADDSRSEVVVTGDGSRWSLDGELTVGGSARGSLTIAAGGRVESADAIVGHHANSNGSVTVTGEASQWTVRGSLLVGEGGSGSLEVQHRAAVTVTEDLAVAPNGLLRGDGKIAGTLHNEGVVAPEASANGLNVTGNAVQDSNGTLWMNLASSNRFAHLCVEGDLSLDGRLEVTLAKDYFPADGTEFLLLDCTGSRTGTFANLVLPAVVHWDTSRLYSEGVLVAGPVQDQTDEDQDGLWDAWERIYAQGLDSLHASGDYDSDGASDLHEQMAGTDPTDPTSVLRISVSRSGNRFFLHWSCVPTRRYTIEASDHLDGQWRDLPEAVLLPGDPAGTMSVEVTPDVDKSHMFWRVRALVPRR